jgi:hypothetical protein
MARGLAAQTGLRLSELIGLDRDAIHLGHGAYVRDFVLDKLLPPFFMSLDPYPWWPWVSFADQAQGFRP